MQKFFIPRYKSATIRIRLDEHGTAVWNLIDGRRTVKDIAEMLAEHFQHEEDYEYRVAAHCSQLYTQGFVKSRT
jgi:nucleoside-diphosphate-sugar epimerase